ncbi:unnamed protein product [Adineta ricciae]|uniref:Uncharacterized protein n=1 Tax=Adineta ricciae TaxID=249248 RepID=A0A814HXE2_ADIRI|nr:unnamed protein product [Adineta ricciae]CAF1174832.1 unnamed protein product [Adineta ricciae]
MDGIMVLKDQTLGAMPAHNVLKNQSPIDTNAKHSAIINNGHTISVTLEGESPSGFKLTSGGLVGTYEFVGFRALYYKNIVTITYSYSLPLGIERSKNEIDSRNASAIVCDDA